MKKITFLLLTCLPLIGFAQVTNGTFDADISGWTNQQTPASLVWDATEGSASAGSMKLVTTSGVTNSGAKSTPNAAPSTAGEYTLSFKVKGTAGDKIQGTMFQSSSGGSQSGSQYTIAATGVWEDYSATFSGLDTGNMNVRIIGKTGGATYFIDDVAFTYVPPAGNTLTVNVVGAGSVALTLDKTGYDPTDVETLTANPSTHWSFSSWSGDLTGSTNPETLTMDANKTVTATFSVAPSFDYDFLFNTNGELEGWETDPQLAIASHTGGQVTLTPTTDQWARFSLFDFPIPTASYNKVTITLKNESTNDDQLTLITINTGQSNTTISQPMTTSDAGFKSYVFDLTQFANWTDDVESIRVRFSDTDNPTIGRSSGTGNIIIDDIVFEFDSSLSVTDASGKAFRIYPNPANNNLNIKSLAPITKVELFDITGKKVLETQALVNDKLNISSLKSGMYLIKIQDSNKSIEVKKLIIK